MADQKKAHIELSLELAEAARKMLVLMQALPTGRQTPQGSYSKETINGILTALARVDLTADELDAIDDVLERLAFPGANRRERESINAAWLVRTVLPNCKGLDDAYDQIAGELDIGKSTVGKHYRKHFPPET